MAAHPYKRLPGRSRRLFNAATLWESEDHLLLVQSQVITENYRRFFFRDIQAIAICQTKAGPVISFVFGLLAVASGVAALFTGGSGAIALSIVAGVFLLLTVINILRGPTCRCLLRTAVQAQELSSLHRLRTARRVLRRIQPKIQSAQQAPSSP